MDCRDAKGEMKPRSVYTANSQTGFVKKWQFSTKVFGGTNQPIVSEEYRSTK